MELFISIIAMFLILLGILIFLFRNRFVFLDGLGENVGTALSAAFVSFGVALLLLFRGVLNG